MKINKSFTLHLIAAASSIILCGCLVATETIPENNYGEMESKIRKSVKDTSDVQAWIEKNIKPMANTDHMFTVEFQSFSKDDGEVDEGSMSEDQLSARWASRFDIARARGLPFEDGQCGWESRKLVKFEHLGELNGGDWFRLTITGGCLKNDYSQTAKRVVKVVSKNGKFQIANLVCL